mgnify:CR=1 FL=1
MLKSKTVCHQGLVREQNEDNYVSNLSESFWVVADGVGGNVGGSIASQLAVQSVERHLRQTRNLVDAIMYANDAVSTMATKQPELYGMATTIMVAQFNDSDFELSWVGDSRAYIIDDDSIRQLSSDHNFANELFLQGDISEKEVATHAGQHELTQALGQLSLPDIPVIQGTLNEGSSLLLCTDGLSGVLTDSEILNVFDSYASLEEISSTLLTKVLAAGAPDNITFTIVSRDSVPSKVEKITLNSTGAKREKNRLNAIPKPPMTVAVLFIVVLVMIIMFYAG